jgi:hypothetical protein
MGSLDGQRPGWESGDLRAEALDVISDALTWQLVDESWKAIERVLIAMDEALAADDSQALAAATADLELAGPVRITRIGSTPVVPPPQPVRDLLNRLVHSLGSTPPKEAAQEPEG